jgi:uncharacterized protein (DUF697 family)/predicted GTPase
VPDRIDDFEPAQFATDAVASRDPVEQFTAEEKEAYESLPPVNIMIAGQAGVGKSTLINAVLRKPVARVGVGEPVTQHIKSYAVPGIPLTLYDTPGLELGENAKDVAREFLKVIEQKRKGPVEEHIHLLWFCISAEGARIQQYERDFIRELSHDVFCVIVLTQCLGEGEERAMALGASVAKAIIEDDLDVVEGRAIKTLALQRKFGVHIIEPFGLDELVEVSYRVLPEAVKRAFVNAQGVNLDLKMSAGRKVYAAAAVGAAGIGAIPIPIPDAVPLTALQAAMMARIAVVMGVDLNHETVAFLLKRVLGMGAMGIIGRQAASMLLKFIPGLGSAINATVAAALTAALGEGFVQLCAEIQRREARGATMPNTEMFDFLLAAFKDTYKKKPGK